VIGEQEGHDGSMNYDSEHAETAKTDRSVHMCRVCI